METTTVQKRATMFSNQPNKETRDAIEEARSGKLRNTPAIDLSSPDAMFKSMGSQVEVFGKGAKK
jgi:hypothetical protein